MSTKPVSDNTRGVALLAFRLLVIFSFGLAIGHAVGKNSSGSHDERVRRDVSFLVEACRKGALSAMEAPENAK